MVSGVHTDSGHGAEVRHHLSFIDRYAHQAGYQVVSETSGESGLSKSFDRV